MCNVFAVLLADKHRDVWLRPLSGGDRVQVHRFTASFLFLCPLLFFGARTAWISRQIKRRREGKERERERKRFWEKERQNGRDNQRGK